MSEEFDPTAPSPKKGPKRRPEPNDPPPPELGPPTMGDEHDAERLEQAYGASTPNDNPEPPAKDLEETPLDEPPDELEPPTLEWQVFENAFGPGTQRVLYRGEPVGVFLDREHHDLSGEAVHDLLVSLGAPEGVPLTYARRRANRDEEMRILQAAGHPAFEGAVKRDAEREAKMDPIRKAFVKSMQEKQGKGKR